MTQTLPGPFIPSPHCREFALPEVSRWVGVVGSRHATPAEMTMARHLGTRLAQQGRLVVSGLALGIDGAAHDGALSIPNGQTIAIVSTAPMEPIYPPEHAHLARRITERGALVHPFSHPAGSPEQRRHRLLERDLLLAQWVSALVVVADAEPIGGGTRWAVGAALQRGIPVFRLDHHGVFHPQPAARPSRVTWTLESPIPALDPGLPRG